MRNNDMLPWIKNQISHYSWENYYRNTEYIYPYTTEDEP